MKVGCQVLWWWVKMMMMMMAMTSTLRDRLEEKGGRRGGGGGTYYEINFPPRQWSTPYIFDNQLHYGRWKLSLCTVSAVDLHPLPSISAAAAAALPTLRGDVRHLVTVHAPLWTIEVLNWFRCVGFAPIPLHSNMERC